MASLYPGTLKHAKVRRGCLGDDGDLLRRNSERLNDVPLRMLTRTNDSVGSLAGVTRPLLEQASEPFVREVRPHDRNCVMEGHDRLARKNRGQVEQRSVKDVDLLALEDPWQLKLL